MASDRPDWLSHFGWENVGTTTAVDRAEGIKRGNVSLTDQFLAELKDAMSEPSRSLELLDG